MPGAELQQLNWVVTVGLLVLLFGGTLTMSIVISRKRENADGYMTAGNKLGFGISAASMTAAWIWAASMYASATSGYKYGLSGPIHYGLWGALMILFIYPFGRRIRKVAPRAHTLAEVMYARHGRSSQLMLAGSNVLGSLISLTSNFIAGGALISLLSPFSFSQGILIIASGVLLYTLWSGFRASVLTDFAQVLAMLGAVAIIIPSVFFLAGGPSMFVDGAANLPRSNRTSSPQSPSSSRARPISRLFWHTRSAIRRLRSDCSQSVRTSSRMVLATGAGLFFASGQMNILDLLVFVGALWGALVFPVIASFY